MSQTNRNSVRSKNLSLKYLTPSGCKDLVSRTFKFKFHCSIWIFFVEKQSIDNNKESII